MGATLLRDIVRLFMDSPCISQLIVYQRDLN